MGIKDILITGRTAKLPGDYGPTEARPKERSERVVAPPSTGQPTRWAVVIRNWMPTPLNKLIGVHWGTASRLKKTDAECVAFWCNRFGVQPATTKRLVRLTIILPPKKRAVDPDALFKSTLDALVGCAALKNDSKDWVEISEPQFARGSELMTVIELEDAR